MTALSKPLKSSLLTAFKVLVLVLMLGSLWLPVSLSRPVHAVVAAQPIVSYRVSGSANYTDPGGEAFWKSIPWVSADLAASVSPGGGHTSKLMIKSANNGFQIVVLLRWNDTQGPSYIGQTEAYKAANGTLIPLTPATTNTVKQLFYNSTYYYPDRVAMLWFVGNSSSQQASPVMVLGTNGALTGGAADIWHWQSNPTDNNKNDASYPGGYTDPVGKPIYPPDGLSFAEDDYTNATGFYVSGGNFGNASHNLDPYANPFVVLAGNQYSSVNKTWTVEMTRTFTTDAPSYRVQLASGSSYHVAFAVWQGRLGESSQLKSVSQWYQLTVGGSPPHVVPVNPGGQGISPLLALAVATGALLVGLLLGSVLMSFRKGTPRVGR